MGSPVDYDALDAALKRCGSSWDAAQAHGLLSGRLAIAGADSGFEWLEQVLEATDPNDVLRGECEALLSQLFEATYFQLSDRQSEFEPLLPGDDDSAAERAAALGHWCEGFLHGLVSGRHGSVLKQRLADEPLADIIRDMARLTRAVADEDADDESNEEAYAEIVEYLRVATQLTYEELADLRAEDVAGQENDGDEPEVLH
jgi:yecA family protein